MSPRIIRTHADYEAALERIDVLMESDPAPGTPEGDELELLALLVEKYEEEKFPMDLPDPIAAIRFRMEQQGLKPRDMVRYLGSPPRVSEVLSGKRLLSLSMIRRLVEDLGIPAEVLLREPGARLPDRELVALAKRFPIAVMVKRGWFAGFEGTVAEAKRQIEDLLAAFCGPIGLDALQPALRRQKVRDGGRQDEHALLAWRLRILTLALQQDVPAYRPGTVTEDFLRELARLSYLDSGPLLAREFLNKNGIRVVVERHLPGTHLDGVATRLPDGSPVIGLTLRYDRLDNFWFTLLHEAAHIAKHLDQNETEAFFDDLTSQGKDRCEKEADNLAADALIPSAAWRAAKLSIRSSPQEIVAFAKHLRISPAIPAGRLCFEAGDYSVFRRQIGGGKVRRLFGLGGD